MNNFVVTVNNKKIKISFEGKSVVHINDKEKSYTITSLNSNTYRLSVGNRTFLISALRNGNGLFNVTFSGRVFETKVLTELQEKAASLIEARTAKHSKVTVKAPMPGMILKLKKSAGDSLVQGDSILILEAMKMENDIKSPISGIIKEIKVKEGEPVEKGADLLTIE